MSDNDKRYFSLFPKTLERCIEPLMKPVLKTQGLAGSKIISDWASIVGPELARRSVPEKLSFPAGKKSGGTLMISVENGFATELQHMQPIILERLASYFGYKAIVKLGITHNWPAARPAEAKKPAKAPLPADCSRMADEVEDDELKAALKSFAQTLSTQS